MSLNHMLIKCTGGYKVQNSQEKNQPPRLHGRHEIVFKNEKELETLISVRKLDQVLIIKRNTTEWKYNKMKR